MVCEVKFTEALKKTFMDFVKCNNADISLPLLMNKIMENCIENFIFILMK